MEEGVLSPINCLSCLISRLIVDIQNVLKYIQKRCFKLTKRHAQSLADGDLKGISYYKKIEFDISCELPQQFA